MSGDDGFVGSGRPPLGVRATALLLNLTGLGIGYAYLGHRVRAMLAVLGTVGLVALAFATDAAGRPAIWRVVVVVWLAAIVGDTWQLSRTPRHVRSTAGAGQVAVGVVLVAAVVAGLVVYGAAGRAVYADALAAQGRGDCTTAVARFETVAGAYELTLSADVPAARSGIVECAAYAAARQAQDADAHPEAVARYRDIRRLHPGTALLPVVDQNLARTYAEWAGSLRASGEYQQAIDVYREQLTDLADERVVRQVREELAATLVESAAVGRASLTPDGDRLAQVRPAVEALLTVRQEFGDTAVAPQVPQAIVDIVTAAVATVPQEDPCAALPVLDYAVGLPVEGTGGVVATAQADRPQRRLDCGIARLVAAQGFGYYGGEADYAAAATEFERLLADHPDSPQAAQARSGAIAGRVGAEHYAPIPVPAPFVGDDTGNNVITLYNDSPVEIQVRLSGPTAHEFTLPPCPECPAQYTEPEDACPTFDGRPSATLRLAAGTYYDLVSAPRDPSIDATPGTTYVDQGYDYSVCLHVEERPSVSPYSPYLPRVPVFPELLEAEPPN